MTNQANSSSHMDNLDISNSNKTGGADIERVRAQNTSNSASVRYGSGRRLSKQLTPRDHVAPPQDGYREKSYPPLTVGSSRNDAVLRVALRKAQRDGKDTCRCRASMLTMPVRVRMRE